MKYSKEEGHRVYRGLEETFEGLKVVRTRCPQCFKFDDVGVVGYLYYYCSNCFIEFKKLKDGSTVIKL